MIPRDKQQIIDCIMMSKRKIEMYAKSAAGFPGIVIPDHIQHNIEICQAAIKRLNERILSCKQ